jgi:hypothetical protein
MPHRMMSTGTLPNCAALSAPIARWAIAQRIKESRDAAA